MKKLVLCLIFVFALTPSYAYKYSKIVTNDIKSGRQICYSEQKKEWSGNLDSCDFVFTKYITSGSGGFSVYKNGDEMQDTGTTYEFLNNGKLTGYNMHTLKFYDISFNGKNLIPRELSAPEVGVLFPDVKIVKISDFTDNKIVLKKPWFKQKTFLLLNDTNKDFYKYQFEGRKKYERITGIFEAKKPQKFIYSHFGSRDKMFPVLEIKVINSLIKS